MTPAMTMYVLLMHGLVASGSCDMRCIWRGCDGSQIRRGEGQTPHVFNVVLAVGCSATTCDCAAAVACYWQSIIADGCNVKPSDFQWPLLLVQSALCVTMCLHVFVQACIMSVICFALLSRTCVSWSSSAWQSLDQPFSEYGHCFGS